jgi:hypothetical protein
MSKKFFSNIQSMITEDEKEEVPKITFRDANVISSVGSVTEPITLNYSNNGYYPNVTVSSNSYGSHNYSLHGINSGYGINYPNYNPSSKISLSGEKADIEINGWSLVDTIKKIEERLNILTPNSKMEKEWDQLRELGEQYRALEKKLLEQSEMWAKLKSMPPPPLNT